MTETSEKIYSFVFKTHQIHELKQAIAALCDPQFNPEGVARIDVDDTGFKFTVWNVESRVLGNLSLVPDVQGDNNFVDQEFFCDENFTPRMIDLCRVFRYLTLVDDNDSLEICHVAESDEICFLFGKDPAQEFSVKLLDLNTEFVQFPIITEPCGRHGAIIPSEDLWEMFPFMSDVERTQNVSVKMTQTYVSITIGRKECRYEGDKLERWNAEEEFSRCFEWPHSELLIFTSYLSDKFLLGCLDDSPDSIILRFPITEPWALTFIRHHATSAHQTYSFSFHVCPITPLKKALGFLTNSSLCQPPALGLIHVSDSGSQIVVRNSVTGVIGLVDLLATGLLNYRFKKGLNGNIVDVCQMARDLSRSDDDDFVGVGLPDGSNHISFKTAWAGAFRAELPAMDGEFQEWPYKINIAYEVIIRSRHVKEMVPLMVIDNVPQSVSLEVQYGFTTLSINGESWDCVYNDELEEQEFQVWFNWQHPETLEQASELADWFSICLLTRPRGSIMLRVKLENIGYLAYINQAFDAIAPFKGHISK